MTNDYVRLVRPRVGRGAGPGIVLEAATVVHHDGERCASGNGRITRKERGAPLPDVKLLFLLCLMALPTGFEPVLRP